MKQRFLTFFFTLLALALVWVGFCSLVLVPFLPLVYLDVPAPEWFGPYAIFGMGLLSIAAGIWLWIVAWRPWLPKQERK